VIAVGDARASSSVVVARVDSRQVAFVADADGQELLTFDVAGAQLLARHSVLGTPEQLLLGERGRLYVASRESSMVQVFDVIAELTLCAPDHAQARDHAPRWRLEPVTSIPTATEPVGMALTPDHEMLLVVSGWGHTLEAFTTSDHRRRFAVDLPREPRAVTVDTKGTRAFVSHASGPGASVVNLAVAPHVARTISLRGRAAPLAERRDRHGAFAGGAGVAGIDPRFDPPSRPARSDLDGAPRVATQGFSIVALTAWGPERVFIPEVLVLPGTAPEPAPRRARKPPRSATGYGTFGDEADLSAFEVTPFGTATGHVAAIDAERETPTPASMILTVNHTPCLLPRAVVADRARQTILVACLGTDEVDEYDAKVPSPSEELVARWKVSAGPTGLALDGYSRLVVWSSFERVLTVIDRHLPDSVVIGSPTREREATPFEVGRALFHSTGNPRIASDGRACASCHPDGRDDGLTWSTPEGPRQTPMLAGRLALTAPFGWRGETATVREHLRTTLQRLGGTGLSDRDTYALLTYLARMRPPPRGRVRDPDKVARGKALFGSYETGCATCHHVSGEQVIGDGDLHDVGSAAKGDVTASFSTPSLQFVGGTPPYFHDGRYATLGELLRGTDGEMGETSHLGVADLEALTAYLEDL
jgi:hypothetical protein